jgi:hypothetical protein
MKTVSVLTALIVVLMFSNNANAQNVIKGSVINEETKEPLVGAYIVALGTTDGTTTNMNGTFEFETTNQVDSLSISYLGFYDMVIKPGSSNLIELNQVVISTITTTTIKETKATSIEQLLNKVTGVYMVDLGNEQHSMSMRQPLSYGGMFLYLEDGIPIRTSGVFNHNALIEINMGSVSNMEIIRGPASSLYGSEAIGGAVNFITHKPSILPTAKAQIQGNNLGYKRADFMVSNTWKNGMSSIVETVFYSA